MYYKPSVNYARQAIKNHITRVFKEIPVYGEKKVHQQLLEDGHKVSLNTIAHYHQDSGLKAVLVVKQVNTTILIKGNRRDSYKLLELNEVLDKYLNPEIFNAD